MRDFHAVEDVYGDGLLAAVLRGVLNVRAQLDEKQAGLPGRRPAVGDLGQASNLLQHFHQFNFSSHTSV